MRIRILGATALLLVAGCGDSASNRPAVFAASSLTDVFSTLDENATYNFGGSDTLAFQIEEGAPADVFASASTKEADELFHQGVVEQPRVFARNRLVVVVPRDNPAGIRTARDLARTDVDLVLAQPGVPAGDYAREALATLAITPGSVVSEEPDVRGVLTKVALGGADAGIVYRTDASSSPGDVRSIPITARAQPDIEYAVAVVRDGPHPPEARDFVDLVLGPSGRAALTNAGFDLP